MIPHPTAPPQHSVIEGQAEHTSLGEPVQCSMSTGAYRHFVLVGCCLDLGKNLTSNTTVLILPYLSPPPPPPPPFLPTSPALPPREASAIVCTCGGEEEQRRPRPLPLPILHCTHTEQVSDTHPTALSLSLSLSLCLSVSHCVLSTSLHCMSVLYVTHVYAGTRGAIRMWATAVFTSPLTIRTMMLTRYAYTSLSHSLLRCAIYNVMYVIFSCSCTHVYVHTCISLIRLEVHCSFPLSSPLSPSSPPPPPPPLPPATLCWSSQSVWGSWLHNLLLWWETHCLCLSRQDYCVPYITLYNTILFIMFKAYLYIHEQSRI